MAYSLPPNFRPCPSNSCRRKKDLSRASTLPVVDEECDRSNRSSLQDVENRLRRVSVDDGDAIDDHINALDMSETCGKDILHKLGVPLSDIELLLADPERKLDGKFVELEQSLSQFSLEQSWTKYFEKEEKRGGDERGANSNSPPLWTRHRTTPNL